MGIKLHDYLCRMSKAAAYILIFFLSFQSLLQLSIFTWYKINQDYIANELCINKNKPAMQCNGHCQLALEMDKTENRQESGKKTLIFKPLSLSVFVVQFASYVFPAISVNALHRTTFLRNLDSGYSTERFQPPIV